MNLHIAEPTPENDKESVTMLTLNWKDGESILIYPREDLGLATTVRELFADGPIVIQFHGRKKGGTGVGLAVPVELEVMREELVRAGSSAL